MLEKLIASWRASLPPEAADELEDHLRESIARYRESGLGEIEAFEAASKAAGSPARITKEFEKIETRGWWAAKLNLGIAAAGALLMTGVITRKVEEDSLSLLLASHVLAVTLGYGGALLTGGLGIAYVLQRAFADFPARRLRRAADAARNFAFASLLFTSAGVFLGMIWTKEAWGRYWDWDPKEIGAFGLILWLAVYVLICRRISPRVTMILAILGNFIVTFAWFGPSGSNSFWLFTPMLFFHIAVLFIATMEPAALSKAK